MTTPDPVAYSELFQETRVVRDVAPPIYSKLPSSSLFNKDGKPNIEALREHLLREGRLEYEDARTLICQAIDVLDQEPNMLEIEAPLTIVGDIHGQFYDLIQIFKDNPPLENSTYLFLGDYVDRGLFSVEVMFYLLALKVQYPNNLYLLRGNHESRVMTDHYTFQQECNRKYRDIITECFISAFFSLPLAAHVKTEQGFLFCVHGGISPELKDIYQINELDRHKETPEQGLFCDLVWADPIEHASAEDLEEEKLHEWHSIEFMTNRMRGCSYRFGWAALQQFLDDNRLLSVIRAHEVQKSGFLIHHFYQCVREYPPLVTVFSAPNYCDMYRNMGAVLRIAQDGSMHWNQAEAVKHPYCLPKYMDAFTYAMPVLVESVMGLMLGMLRMAELGGEEEEENMEEESSQEIARSRIVAKIRSMAKMRIMIRTLREQQEELVKLKGLCGGELPKGVLLGGEHAVAEAIQTFEQAYEFDLESEKRPGLAHPIERHFPYSELSTNPPPSCNPETLEDYLSPEEFESVFGMPKTQFFRLQSWKQLQLKKEKSLW